MKYLFSFLIIAAFLITIDITFEKTSVQASFKKTIGDLSQETSQPLEVSKILDGGEKAETLGKRILTDFPKALEKSWQNALAFWQKTINWFKNFWYSYVFPWLQNIWYKINSFLGKEVEKRKPEIKEEFEKEKQEMKEDIPKVSKSLWQRFLELIRTFRRSAPQEP